MSLMITAIDPGPTRSAYLEWDGQRITSTGLCDNDVILTSASLTTGRLWIERVASYGMPVGAEVFDTCIWTGRFAQVYDGDPSFRTARFATRHAVKMHLCHSPKANDSTVRQALIDRFGAPWTWTVPDPAKPKKRIKVEGVTFGLVEDLWAAFALAVYAFDMQSQELPCLAPGS